MSRYFNYIYAVVLIFARHVLDIEPVVRLLTQLSIFNLYEQNRKEAKKITDIIKMRYDRISVHDTIIFYRYIVWQ